MSDPSRQNASGSTSQNARSGTTPAPPKAIGSLAKKQSDVTRQGTQKLKFVPTLPSRRKKEEDAKQQPAATPSSSSAPDRGRGRGRGRGGPPRPASQGMTASGPFAMGPTLAGIAGRRSVPRSNFSTPTPSGALASSSRASLGASLSQAPPPSLKKEKAELPSSAAGLDEDIETYSDPDEGVEIIDMDDVRLMDWMAPDSLRKEKPVNKKKKKKAKPITAEKPEPAGSPISKVRVKDEPQEVKLDVEITDAVNDMDTSKALDLSESEGEEEMENLMEDFIIPLPRDSDELPEVREEKLYLFQFPHPFPTFVSTASNSISTSSTIAPSTNVDVDTSPSAKSSPDSKSKRVSFAADVKPPAPDPLPAASTTSTQNTSGQDGSSSEAPKDAPDPKLEGIIGQLEVYESGAVKMRIGNDILLDVTPATQTSFLQNAVHVDVQSAQLKVLGEINKRFVVSPDLDQLLHMLEMDDLARDQPLQVDEGLIQMDET